MSPRATTYERTMRKWSRKNLPKKLAALGMVCRPAMKKGRTQQQEMIKSWGRLARERARKKGPAELAPTWYSRTRSGHWLGMWCDAWPKMCGGIVGMRKGGWRERCVRMWGNKRTERQDDHADLNSVGGEEREEKE